ncbi:MAG: hypothetical protein ACU833_06405 [Gammaproteobacteria bacterium]
MHRILSKTICGLAGLILTSCSSSYEVTTWNEWCDHENSRGVAEKGSGIVISYNYRKIREDFVKDYNEILVEEVVSNHFWDTKLHSNEEVEKLIEAHKLGFWMEGNNLHFSNTHLSHKEFEGDVARFKKFLSFDALKKNKYRLNGFQLCIYKTIDSLFETFMIHTKEETTTLPLDFTLKSFFGV